MSEAFAWVKFNGLGIISALFLAGLVTMIVVSIGNTFPSESEMRSIERRAADFAEKTGAVVSCYTSNADVECNGVTNAGHPIRYTCVRARCWVHQ